MAEAGTIKVKLQAVTTQFKAGMKDAAKAMGGLSGKLAASGTAITAATVAFTALGVGITKSVGKFAEFEAAIDRVGAITGLDAGSMQLKAMEDQARSLGSTTKYTAVQVGEAYNFMAMAGMDANTIMEATPSVLQLASAGALELGDAANIVTNIMAGFGQGAADLAHTNDVLTAAITGANVNVQQMGEALKYAGPVAKAAGISFEDATTAIALMGNAGIQGSLAGTSLRGAISGLLSPTKKAADIMKRLGVEVKDSQGNLIPFGDILKEFSRVGLSAGDAMEIFGLRAGPGMLSLLEQGTDAFDKFNGRLQESGGLAERIAGREMNTLQGRITALSSAFEGMMITIGKAFKPFAHAFVLGLTGITNSVTWLFDKFEKLIKLLAFVTEFGVEKGFENFVIDETTFQKVAKDAEKKIPPINPTLDLDSISSNFAGAIEDGAEKAKPEFDFSEMDWGAAKSSIKGQAQGQFEKLTGAFGDVARALDFQARMAEENAKIQDAIYSEWSANLQEQSKRGDAAVEDLLSAIFSLGGKLAPTFAALFKDIQNSLSGAGYDFKATFASIAIVALQNSRAMMKLTEMFNKVAEALGKFLDAIIYGIGDMFSSVGNWFSSLGGSLRGASEGVGTFSRTMQDAIKTIKNIISDKALEKAIEDTLLSGDVSGLTPEQKEQLRGQGEELIKNLNEDIAKIDWGIVKGDAGALREQRDKIQAAVDGIAEPLAAGGKNLKDTVKDMTEATAGVPTGVKVALSRFRAADAVTSPARSAIMPGKATSNPLAATVGGTGNQIIIENVSVATEDPKSLLDGIVKEAETQVRASSGSLSRAKAPSVFGKGIIPSRFLGK